MAYWADSSFCKNRPYFVVNLICPSFHWSKLFLNILICYISSRTSSSGNLITIPNDISCYLELFIQENCLPDLLSSLRFTEPKNLV